MAHTEWSCCTLNGQARDKVMGLNCTVEIPHVINQNWSSVTDMLYSTVWFKMIKVVWGHDQL